MWVTIWKKISVGRLATSISSQGNIYHRKEKNAIIIYSSSTKPVCNRFFHETLKLNIGMQSKWTLSIFLMHVTGLVVNSLSMQFIQFIITFSSCRNVHFVPISGWQISANLVMKPKNCCQCVHINIILLNLLWNKHGEIFHPHTQFSVVGFPILMTGFRLQKKSVKCDRTFKDIY